MSHRVAWLGRRMGRELRELCFISSYLYICFAAISLYKAAVLRANGIEYWQYGAAAIQALLVGKFIIIGHAIGLGERVRPRRLLLVLIAKSVSFLLFLMVLCAAEEVVRDLIHGRSVITSIQDLQGGTLLQVLASSLLMLLILIPYVAFREVARMLGPERLRALLLERGSP